MSTLRSVQKFNSFGYSQLVLPSQSLLSDRNFENALRKIGQEKCMRKLFGHINMPKKVGSHQENINDTSFTKCHSGQNRKRNIGELFLNMEMKSFAIFDQDMTQTIYENYLGIFGWTDIQVASQPRADGVIPSQKKEFSLEKDFRIWSRSEVT